MGKNWPHCLRLTNAGSILPRRSACASFPGQEGVPSRPCGSANLHCFCRWLMPVLSVMAVLLILALGAVTALADTTPTPTPHYRVFLPIIVKDNAPAQPVTVTFQYGNNNYMGVTDTYISSYGDPYAPHGYEPILAVRWQRSQVADAEAGLMRFDLTSIPASALVQSATLKLYVTDRTNVNPMTLSAFGVLRPWALAEANWYSATLTSAWAAPGCNGIGSDRQGLATSSADLWDVGMWIELPVTPLVQEWVHNPSVNYGLALKPTGTSATPSVRYELAASLYPDTALRPILTVTYILLPPPPPTVAPTTATPTPTPTTPSGLPTPTATASPTPSPTWTPLPSWWSTNYSYRRRLLVQAADGYAIAAGYAVSLTLDTDQLIADGKLRPDRRDWRIVAWNGLTWMELDRHVVSARETWFSTVRPIPSDAGDDLYYVYYGNPQENTEPRDDKNNIYAFYDDFDTYDANKWPWPPPTGVEVSGGVITVTAYNPSGGPADSCPGAYDCMLSRQTFGLGYQVEERARHPDYVYGKYHDADQGFSDDGHTNEAKMRSYNVAQFQRVNRDGTASVVMQCCKPANTDWHIFRVTRLDASRILFQVDDSPVDISTTHLPLIPLSVHIRAYSSEPFEPSRNVVDWIKVRPVVAVEPTVTWGSEEMAIFTP